jgi:hypothetical protein
VGDGIWVTSGPGLPCGARKLDPRVMGDAPRGRTWVDVCIIGQHLPQMYRDTEISTLDAGGCERLGLCPDCLGFGDTAPGVRAAFDAARAIDQIARPCANCGGSGRPAIRVSVTRTAGATTGSIRPLPHAYIPPLDPDPELAAAFGAAPDMCLACGMPPDGKGPRDETLHPGRA